MSKASLKEVVKKMCKSMPGGRSAMAGALGMSLETFNNNLYEKNGCRFFEVDELEAIEDLSGTNYLAEYYALRRDCLLVETPKLDELDQVELFTKSIRTAAHGGYVDQIINNSLQNGVITDHEAQEILKYHRKHLAARDAEIRAIIMLFSKSKKGEAPELRSEASCVKNTSVEYLTHD